MPKEVNLDTTELRQCCRCGRTIMARFPKDLKGEFAHTRCESRDDDSILDAELLSGSLQSFPRQQRKEAA